jgi:hypothetical protein
MTLMDTLEMQTRVIWICPPQPIVLTSEVFNAIGQGTEGFDKVICDV